jgi:hypothetical protein
MKEQAPQLLKESLSTAPDIHFERAIHAPAQAEANLGYQRFLQGDKTAHGWNREVAESMVSYKPLFLALDGQTPLQIGEFSWIPGQNPLPLTDTDKQLLWFALPGAPSEINDKGMISVVAGDVLYSNIFPFVRNKKQMPQEALDTLDTLERDSSGDLFGNPKINELAQLFEMSAEDLVITLPMALLARNILRRAIHYQPTKYSRREFFKRSLPVVAGAAAFLSGLGGLTYERYEASKGEQIAYASNEQTRQELQIIAAIMRPRLARSIYADGRTALLDAKLRAFMQGKEGAGAIVMGAYHEPDVLNTADETTLIHDYAKDILETVDEIFDAQKVKLDPLERAVRRQALLRFLAKGDVYTVTDPGCPTINPNLPKIVPQHVRYEGTFQCPQVEQAVSELQVSSIRI